MTSGRTLGAVTVAALIVFMPSSGAGQTMRSWEVRGDTSGAPRGCSAEKGLDAIDAWFAAMNNRDSAAFSRVVPLPHFTFSTGRFTSTEPFFVARSMGELAGYVRRRATQHERLTLTAITFNRWRGQDLEFGPIYFTPTADDLGPSAKFGSGKGMYRCEQGVAVMNLGPRPAWDDGRSDMRRHRGPPDVDRRDLEVYRAVLDSMFTPHAGSAYSQIAVNDRTRTLPRETANEVIESLMRAPGVDATIARDVVARSYGARSLRAIAGAHLRTRVLLADSASLAALPRAHISKFWNDFYSRFPHTNGLIQLSGIGYNADHNLGAVIVDVGCGGRCGNGYIVVVKRENGSWRIANIVDSRIS